MKREREQEFRKVLLSRVTWSLILLTPGNSYLKMAVTIWIKKWHENKSPKMTELSYMICTTQLVFLFTQSPPLWNPEFYFLRWVLDPLGPFCEHIPQAFNFLPNLDPALKFFSGVYHDFSFKKQTLLTIWYPACSIHMAPSSRFFLCGILFLGCSYNLINLSMKTESTFQGHYSRYVLVRAMPLF